MVSLFPQWTADGFAVCCKYPIMTDMITEKNLKLDGSDAGFETFKCPDRFLNGCNTLAAELSFVQCIEIFCS